MNRRTWLGTLFSSLVSLPFVGRQLLAEGETASLYDTLRFGLRCRRDVEFEFVALVVEKVESGILPKDMVLSMFKWSRERRPHLPFPYFQAGLQLRAKEIGVEL